MKLDKNAPWTKIEMIQAMESMREELTQKGLNVVYICIYGSQNYDLEVHDENYQSDLDMKAVVAPNLDDLVNGNKQVTFTHTFEYGQVDVKDIRLFTNNVKKANPAYIECLFTNYCWIQDSLAGQYIRQMRAYAEVLCKAQSVQSVKAMFGMMKEKEKALCHPYPTIKHKIDKWGYDGKQLSHALRLHDMMYQWLNGSYMATALKPDGAGKKKMISYKKNEPTLEQAKDIMSRLIASAKEMTDKHVAETEQSNQDLAVLDYYDQMKSGAIKQAIVNDITNTTLNQVISKVEELYK